MDQHPPRPRPPVVDWFQTEILPWRIYDSIFRSTLLQFLVLLLFLLLQTFSPLHPWTSLTSALSSLLSPSSWLYLALVVACLTGHGLLVGRHLSLEPFVPTNRFSAVLRAMESSTLLALSTSAIIGGCMMRCYLGLQGGAFNAMSGSCYAEEPSVRCLNESHLFLVFSGVFTGLAFWRQLLLRNGNLVYFSPIQQHGSSQLRMKLYGLVRESVLEALLNMRWFCMFHVIVGYRVSSALGDLLRLGTNDKWDSSFVLIQINTLFACWALNSLLLFALRFSTEVTFIGITKPLPLEVEGRNNSLAEAMAQKHSKLLRYLAFQEWTNVALYERPQRDNIYKLSQPGGHPRNWTSLYKASMEVLDEFLQDLSKSSLSSSLTSKAPPSTGDENLARGFVIGKASAQPIADKKLKGEWGGKNFWVTVETTWSNMQKNYLFSAYGDANVRSVFAQSQIIIWAVEGLSQIVSNSVFEDRFGVVQKNLPNIVVMLLNLQQTVERHKGSSVNLKKMPCDMRDIQLKQELKCAIKTALYRICISFGDSISDIQLPPEFKLKINNFRNFMEG